MEVMHEIIAETINCQGETGFTSFESTKLHKISEAWCADPNDSGKKLQQVMIKSPSTSGGFQVVWVTQQEARNIMQQIKEGRAIKFKRLYGPDVRIDVHHHDNGKAKPEKPAPTATTRSEPAEKVLEGPSIDMLDPVLSNTRSITHVMTGANLTSRAIVGKGMLRQVCCRQP
eukprot:TRINITY_DN183392_c0_g1_i1.p1 TRINITY_DN183392_c0_g1~~TRINITY_DN183392_c0_g1_i1.p1  ORF type:complete len:193 (+),score=0.19 TRINITY_DN183392_c0_g1_i1:64-579(+)